MTFQESIKTCLTKYADFNGRAVRSEYWWFALAIFIIGAVFQVIHPAIAGVFYLGTLLPSLAAATRRLHDTNRSGWWQLIVLLPLIGLIILIVFLAQEGKSEEVTAAA